MLVISPFSYNFFFPMVQVFGQGSGETNVTQTMITLLSNIAGAPKEENTDTAEDRRDNLTTPNNQKSMNPSSSHADSQSIFLGDISIPSGGLMFIYEASPFIISEGHLTAGLPCNEDSIANVNLLVGNISNLKTIPLESISVLSTPGDICSYEFSLSNNTNPISHIAIQNNSTEEIEFPTSSTITIGVSKSLNKSD